MGVTQRAEYKVNDFGNGEHTFPQTWISTEAVFDTSRGLWCAQDEEGFVAWSENKHAAILLCFAKHMNVEEHVLRGSAAIGSPSERPFGCSSDCRAPGCGGGCSQ